MEPYTNGQAQGGAAVAPLSFERLVGSLAKGCAAVEPGAVDARVDATLRQLAEALDLDLALLGCRPERDGLGGLALTWARDGAPSGLAADAAAGRFPWTLAQTRDGQPLCAASLHELADDGDRARLDAAGVRSLALLPLTIGGHPVGILGLVATRAERTWPREVVAPLQRLAHVLTYLLTRRDPDALLHARVAHLRALADNAPVMIWESGKDRQCTWFNRQRLDFVGRSLEEEIGDGWTACVHPEDLPACLEIDAASFEARRAFSREYRLRRHDGAWRWVIDNGVPSYGADGAFTGYLGSCIDITEQQESKRRLEEALAEVRRLQDELRSENVSLRREVQERLGTSAVVGRTPGIRRVLEQIEQVAPTDATVLLLGETGTGKELFAGQIHERSARRGRVMVRVNCAAIPATLIESELFGRERGAFTGALARQAGRFELADHSTIFLDEIGDLPAEAQVKLLRVLEERRIERLGSARSISVDIRIVAATHRDLEQLIAQGSFREDLYYRLNVFPIRVPPLRERAEDIPLLIWRFVEEFSKAFGRRIESIGKDNIQALQQYAWPGNIRELRNVVERAMIAATGSRLTIPVPASSSATAGKRSVKLEDVEKGHIRSVLEGANWRIRGVGGAAERLGMKPTTLETRMAKLGLKRPSAQ